MKFLEFYEVFGVVGQCVNAWTLLTSNGIEW